MVQMIRSLATYIPIVGPLLFFDWRSHYSAFPKAFIILLAAMSPVLLSTVFTPAPDEVEFSFKWYFSEIHRSFTISEIYVYVASLVVPFLYILLERFKHANDATFVEQLRSSYRLPFTGFIVYWLGGVAIFLLAILTYSATKTSPDLFERTLIHHLTFDKAYWIYLAAVYLWYLSLLDATAPRSDFVASNRRGEEEFADEFAKRLGSR